ncbi:ANTAR domain-containing protein [Friedmanniella luteola]|uniref:ANTAR domain-containing protein n=1 Tax=Friedmanniella luteola TaxID=546871 RepID=A0A1H1XLN4_9ACTN|nr:GAF and ANTAR domain-containing protein [Friedmanniella luteola]SDT10112.1 ANTAR domain-containing protein [Friedmanniella luteola]
MSDPGQPTTTPAVEGLAGLLLQLGGVVLSAETLETAVALVTRLAAVTIPGTAGAGVTLVDSRGRRTTAASDPLVGEADALQYAFDSGPCLTAWSERVTVRIDRLDSEERWPRWTAAAAELGIRSMVSLPLVADDVSVGAIKVYSREAGAYDARAEAVLGLFAEQAAVLLTNMLTLSDARQLSAQLSGALQRRDLIGQATGVLIGRGAGDRETAFALLVEASQRSDLKVHEVAAQLVASAAAPRLDAPPPPSPSDGGVPDG